MPKKKKPTIKVCTGPCCAERKSKKIAKRLLEEIEQVGMQDNVSVKKCDCVGHCKAGPVVLFPQSALAFEGVKPKDIPKVLRKIITAME